MFRLFRFKLTCIYSIIVLVLLQQYKSGPLLLVFLFSYFSYSEVCRKSAFVGVYKDKAFNKSIIRNVTVQDEELCQWRCFLYDNCKSYNLGPPEVGKEGKRVCELSSSHHVLHPEHLVSRPGFIYRSSVVS